MRTLALTMLTLNLLFFGWSRLVAGDTSTQRQNRPVVAAAPAAPVTKACATIGPITESGEADVLRNQLESAGWGVMRREATVQVNNGYWVVLADLGSTSRQDRVVRTIMEAGIKDAFAMPDDPSFRVSAGLFTNIERAEDRANRVRSLNLNPQVLERTQDIPALWLDIPGVSATTLGDGRLGSAGITLDEELELSDCP